MNAQQETPTQTRSNVVPMVPRHPRAGEPDRKSSPPDPDHHESHDEPGYGHGV